MATASSSTVSNENCYYSRISKLLIDGATVVLKEVFDNIHKPQPLRAFLSDPRKHAILKNLKTTKNLTPAQWNKLYPTVFRTVNSNSFDITLLCVLLQSICNLPPPTAGWNTPPAPTSINTADDIVRIRLWRNELVGLIPKAALSNIDFHKYWDEIEKALVRLGGAKYQPVIEKLKIVSMDPDDEEYYTQCLEEWYESDERVIKALEAKEGGLILKMDETQASLMQKTDELSEKHD